MNRNFYIQHLNLIKHPEGGYFREIFRSGATSMASKGATDRNGTLVSSDRQAFPEDDGKRNDLTSIYWMAVKENLLLLCRNESDHIHYFLKGAPFQYWITNPKTGETETLILGPDLANGHVLQIPVKGGYWKCGRLLDDDEFDFALIAEAVGPGFDFRDFRLISKDEFSYLTTSDSRDRDNLALFLQKEEDAKGYQGNGFHDGIYS